MTRALTLATLLLTLILLQRAQPLMALAWVAVAILALVVLVADWTLTRDPELTRDEWDTW